MIQKKIIKNEALDKRKIYAVLTVICFAASALVWKVAPCPPRSRIIDSWSRRPRIYLESPAASALVWNVALYPSWSVKSCRLYPGLESCTVSTSVANNIILVAPSPPRSETSRRLRLGLKLRAVSVLV